MIDNFESEEFESFLLEAFKDGNVSCELRLSDDEVSYIRQNYPFSTFIRISEKKDVKTWFIVELGIY